MKYFYLKLGENKEINKSNNRKSLNGITIRRIFRKRVIF